MLNNEERKLKRLNNYQPSQRNMYKTAMQGRSRKKAIRAHCIMCMGYQSHEVAKCSAVECPLYPYRMGESATTRKSNAKE